MADALRRLTKDLPPHRVQRISEMAEAIKDIHTSATTVMGPAQTQVFDRVGLLVLHLAVRTEFAEQAVEDLKAAQVKKPKSSKVKKSGSKPRPV